ncbi:MAG: radical SAM protein [Rikenellaceae bacterium]
MKFTGITYRPPVEAMMGTELLQVTEGCAHNACTFCTMYADKFKVEHLSGVEQDIRELRMLNPHIERIFLVNGDAFVLSANKLQAISDLIIKYIPEVEVITMYASISNVKAKNDEDLQRIKDMRINDLWMGLETGREESIKYINKGHTLADAYEQLERLNRAGIRHCDAFMLGVAGSGKGIENAEDTARLINASGGALIWFGTLGLFEGSEMSKAAERGEFIPATEREIIEEEIRVLELLEVDNVPFYGIHPTNTSSIQGMIPRDRETMIGHLKHYLNTENAEFLDSAMRRDTL